jgi:hypothetical protein
MLLSEAPGIKAKSLIASSRRRAIDDHERQRGVSCVWLAAVQQKWPYPRQQAASSMQRVDVKVWGMLYTECLMQNTVLWPHAGSAKTFFTWHLPCARCPYWRASKFHDGGLCCGTCSFLLFGVKSFWRTQTTAERRCCIFHIYYSRGGIAVLATERVAFGKLWE